MIRENQNRYAALILAAGYSSRMRGFKPLLQIDGLNLIERLIETYQQNGVDIVLVGGYRFSELCAGISNSGIQIVENKDFASGMFSSIQTGLRCLKPGYRSVFISPVDIPLVRPYTIQRLVSTAEQYPGVIVYPVFKKMRGHPPLIPVELADLILNSPADQNLKSILRSNVRRIIELEVPDRNILFDIDTPEDYQKAIQDFQNYEIPDKDECEVIINNICRLAPELLNHCVKVTAVADAICRALIKSRVEINKEIVRAAAILHDIAKGQPDHDQAGAALLTRMGFGRTGEIVKWHTDLSEKSQNYSLETKVVFLADKSVDGKAVISIEERYQSALNKYGDDPESKKNIISRRDRALQVKAEIESLCGLHLEKVIPG